MTRMTCMAYLRGISQLALAALAMSGVAGMVRAEDPQNLEFKGVLVTPPPCNINSDGTIVTDFGDKVGIRRIASGIYRKEIEDLPLTCEEGSSAWQLTISVSGTAASFDSDNATVVTPQQADLGVKLLLDGRPFELNKAVKINAEGLPKLEAMLVQRPGVELEEGPFTAQAILKAEYQ